MSVSNKLCQIFVKEGFLKKKLLGTILFRYETKSMKENEFYDIVTTEFKEIHLTNNVRNVLLHQWAADGTLKQFVKWNNKKNSHNAEDVKE